MESRAFKGFMAVTSESRPWPLRERIEVTFRDLDLAGHVNNAVVFTWMETLRLHHYVSLTGLKDVWAIDFIVAESQAKYFQPVRYSNKVVGELAPSNVGKTSWELIYRFTDEETKVLLMRGRSVQVCFDYRTQAKKPIPEKARETLLAQLVDPEAEGWPRQDRKNSQ